MRVEVWVNMSVRPLMCCHLSSLSFALKLCSFIKVVLAIEECKVKQKLVLFKVEDRAAGSCQPIWCEESSSPYGPYWSVCVSALIVQNSVLCRVGQGCWHHHLNIKTLKHTQHKHTHSHTKRPRVCVLLMFIALCLCVSLQATDNDIGTFGVVRYYFSDEPDQWDYHSLTYCDLSHWYSVLFNSLISSD